MCVGSDGEGRVLNGKRTEMGRGVSDHPLISPYNAKRLLHNRGKREGGRKTLSE